MFLGGLRKHLLLRLDKIVYQFTFFPILEQLLHFYCIAFLLYKWNLPKYNMVKYAIKTNTLLQHGKIRHKDEHIITTR